MSEKGSDGERERFLVGAVWREFNPCLSSLEAIVALSQTYQLSHSLTRLESFKHTCAKPS